MADNRPGRRSPQENPLLTAFGLSNLADGLTTILVLLLAVQVTRAPLVLGLVTFCRSAPWAVFAPFAGVIADRADRRRVLLIASSARCAALGLVTGLLLWGHAGVAVVIVLALLLGCCEVLYDTTAQSVLPSLVEPARLGPANARLSVVETVTNQLFGPALAGLVAGLALHDLAAVACVSYGLAAVFVLRLRMERIQRERRGVRTEMRAGFSFLWQHRGLRRLVWLTGLSAFVYSGWLSQFVLFAVAPGPLNWSVGEFGLATALAGLGGVFAASLTVRFTRRFNGESILSVTTAIAATALLLCGLALPFAATSACLMLYAATVVAWNVITVTYRQKQTPAAMLGRVNAAYRTVAWGATPLGALFGGLVGQLTGPRGALLILPLALLIRPLFVRRVAVGQDEADHTVDRVAGPGK